MSNGTDIAAEIAAGLAEAGEATGDGPLICALRKPGGGATPWDDTIDPGQLVDVTAVQTTRTERDGTGDVRRVMRVLLINATGPVVEKGDQVAVGVRAADVTEQTRFNRIGEVKAINTGGVPLLYKADMDD